MKNTLVVLCNIFAVVGMTKNQMVRIERRKVLFFIHCEIQLVQE